MLLLAACHRCTSQKLRAVVPKTCSFLSWVAVHAADTHAIKRETRKALKIHNVGTIRKQKMTQKEGAPKDQLLDEEQDSRRQHKRASSPATIQASNQRSDWRSQACGNTEYRPAGSARSLQASIALSSGGCRAHTKIHCGAK